MNPPVEVGDIYKHRRHHVRVVRVKEGMRFKLPNGGDAFGPTEATLKLCSETGKHTRGKNPFKHVCRMDDEGNWVLAPQYTFVTNTKQKDKAMPKTNTAKKTAKKTTKKTAAPKRTRKPKSEGYSPREGSYAAAIIEFLKGKKRPYTRAELQEHLGQKNGKAWGIIDNNWPCQQVLYQLVNKHCVLKQVETSDGAKGYMVND